MNRPHANHENLERIQFVAAHYNRIAGLRALPIALLLLLLPLLTGSLVTGTAHTVLMWSAPFLLVGAAVLGYWAHRHYRDRFGQVKAASKPLLTNVGVMTAAAGVLAAGLYIQWVGWEASLPFSPTWTLLWVAILAMSLRYLRFVPHYAAVAALGLATAVAPLAWLPGLDAHPYSADTWGLFVMGLLLLVLAYLDHRFLSRVLAPLPEGRGGVVELENGRVSG